MYCYGHIWALGLRGAPCASLEQLARWADVWTTVAMRSSCGCGMGCREIGTLKCVTGMSLCGSDAIVDVVGGWGGDDGRG